MDNNDGRFNTAPGRYQGYQEVQKAYEYEDVLEDFEPKAVSPRAWKVKKLDQLNIKPKTEIIRDMY